MEPIGAAASITTLISITAKTIKYLSSADKASDERKALSREATDLLQVLISLQNRLDEPQQSEPWHENVRRLATEHGAFEQLREALEKLAVKLKPEKGIKNKARNLIWTLHKTECEDTLNKIERVKSRVSLALQGDNFKLSQAIKADTAGIDVVNKHVSEWHIKDEARRRQDVFAWFSPLNFYKSHQDIFRRREEGTGEWLINSPEFQNWIVGRSHTLCCPGIPGAGKSVLASIVVNHLRNNHISGCPFGVVAAYCNFKEKDAQSPENLIAGLCVQLMDGSRPAPESLLKLYESHKPKQTRPATKDTIDVLKDTLKPFETVYVVVDALDECLSDVRDILLPALKALQPTIRLIATTRPIIGIISQVDANAVIEIRASYNDLKKYILSSLLSNSGLANVLQARTSLSNDICDKVISKANGMFLAAKLHLDSLSTKTSVAKLKKAIQTLPSTINELYDEAFRRIDDQNEDYQDLAIKALRWVAYAYRPLSVGELQEALAIEPDQMDFDLDAIPDITNVLNVCAGLLIVDEEVDLVRLVHYTAQDYFDELLTSRYQDVHASIGGECITYLNYDVFQSRQRLDQGSTTTSSLATASDPRLNKGTVIPKYDLEVGSEAASSNGQCSAPACGSDSGQSVTLSSDQYRYEGTTYKLLDYICKFWAQHVSASQGTSLSIQLDDFLSSNPRIGLKEFQHTFESPADLETCNDLGIAAYHGLHDPLRRLLKQNRINIDSRSYQGQSSLHLAVYGNQVGSIHILLEHGADIDCTNYYGATPLILAMAGSRIEAARMLVEKGADVLKAGLDGSTPFAIVEWDSPIPFLQLLLDRGADINSFDGRQERQLMRRAGKNDLETLRWLLAKGARVNLQDDAGQTALHWAAECGSAEVVGLLLKNGADTNIIDNSGRTVLHSAARSGSVQTIDLLLGHGAEPSMISHTGQNALHKACIWGNATMVRRLLTTDIDIDAVDSNGHTALHLAAYGRKSECVELLLANLANVDLQDNRGYNFFHYSVAKGDSFTVSSLEHRAALAQQTRLGFTLKYRKSSTIFPPGLKAEVKSLDDPEQMVACFNAQEFLHSVTVLNMLRHRNEILECRVWEAGMTALDIAVVRNDAEFINLLEPLTGPRTKSTIVAFDKLMCDLSGFSSVTDLEEELERRMDEKIAEWEREDGEESEDEE